MNKAIAKPWLSMQCQMIPGVRDAVFAGSVCRDGSFGTLETWPDEGASPPATLGTAREALASGRAEVREAASPDGAAGDGSSWVIACPLRRSGKVDGAVAVTVDGLTQSQVPVVTQLLEWGSAWPGFIAEQTQPSNQPDPHPILAVAISVLESPDLPAATTAAANAVARACDCAQVAVGLAHKGGIRVEAIAGRAVFDRRVNRVRRIEAAMNEAFDQASTTHWPWPPDAPACVNTEHRQLAEGNDTATCTLLLKARGEIVGAVTFERSPGTPFEPPWLAHAEAVAALLGPALHMRTRADRGVFGRARDNLQRLAEKLFGNGHLHLKLSSAGGAILLAFLAFASGTYTVPASAVLQGTIQREIVAPVDGFVADVQVRAGARVHAGEVLARLDEATLQLEQQRLQSELAELANQHDQALAALDHAATRVLQAQIAQAQARIGLARQKLEQLRIVAPFDALVVSGDLSQSLGSPVSRGDELFRLAPLDDYRVILQVREGDMPSVQVGANGRLVLAALPGERFSVTVVRVNGMARVADGRNVLEVEATLDAYTAQLRPGMEGVVRLDAGRARLLWIWTHRTLDRLRLWLWAWSPVA